MSKRIVKTNGAIEYIDTQEEKIFKTAHKGKAATDLNLNEVKELVYKIAKHLNLIE